MGPVNVNYKLGIQRLNHLSSCDKQHIELQQKPAQAQQALMRPFQKGNI